MNRPDSHDTGDRKSGWSSTANVEQIDHSCSKVEVEFQEKKNLASCKPIWILL